MSSKFTEYQKNAWATHSTESRKIADEFRAHLPLIESADDITEFARLVTHICGEHLGEWQLGLELLKRLKNNSLHTNKAAMQRYVAILELGNNAATSIENFSQSDKAIIFSYTASALGNLGGIKRSDNYLAKAEELILTLPSTDAAHEALAKAKRHLAK